MIEKQNWNRRDFLFSVSGLLAGTCLNPNVTRLSFPFQQAEKLAEELSDEEAEWVKKSSMAREIMDYFGKGYSCAESILMVSLNHLELSEKFLWASCGFGGGMGKKDLCGLLTGGFMGLGFAAGEKAKERREGKSLCSTASDQYWKWWQSQAPLKCKNIRTPGTSSKVCRRLGLLAAVKVQELIEEMKV
ncbi:MAG: hypothetical protein GF421_09895 [Candidatus Aminicenantes bacterium]|nr:hypothetical protein [Candidatus Aminicenantes bacterium]